MIDYTKWKQHVLDVYPDEACALIVGDEVVICDNIATQDKTKQFKIDPKEIITHQPDKIIHSHTVQNEHWKIDPRTPSATDLNSQSEMNIPWGICYSDGDGVSDLLWIDCDDQSLPLLNRPFVHGVTDCYNLVRDYYWQKFNIKLTNHPRDYNWWDQTDENGNTISLYDDLFESQGFREITLAEMKPGDMIYMKIMSKVNNHAGVYIGNGRFIHHLAGRRSTVDSVARWKGKFARILRYKGVDEMIFEGTYDTIDKGVSIE